MLIYALIVFTVGASAGLALAAAYVLRRRLAPWPLSLLHAMLASIHLRGQVAKKPIVFLHASVAAIGFLALFGAVLGMF
ncbi:MAG TPA: hypothetical protein VNO18_01995 [Xanthobacteraceae bacterium]|jgi:hypothetical protein|nr:hypothetical protein [Xanthobacteraceae bacterium]